MDYHSELVTLGIVALTVFLSLITALKYVIRNNFIRTRLIMSSFVIFIIFTMGVSFWDSIQRSLVYIGLSLAAGMVIGYAVAVQAEKEKIRKHGLHHYAKHFAHVHVRDFKALTWWSFINFYSIIGGLALINLIGLSTVIFRTEVWAIFSLTVGAFLLGTLLPYVIHLWSIKPPKNA
jgi:hypothetical protein